MPNPIKLTKQTKGIWASSPADVSGFIDRMLTLTVTVTANAKAKKIDPYLEKLRANLGRLFQPEVAGKLAIFGAYFRARANKDMVAFTDDDIRDMRIVLNKMGHHAEPEAFLNSFISSGRVIPRDAHMAFLKVLVLPESEKVKDGTAVMLALVKSKHEKIVRDMLDLTFSVVDFVATPFEVLKREADLNPDKHSGMGLQWANLTSGVSQVLVEMAQFPKQSNVAVSHVHEVRMDLLKLQGAYGMQETALQFQDMLARLMQENKALKAKLEELGKYILSTAGDKAEPFSMEVDFAKYIREYGEQWRERYNALKAKLDAKPAENLQRLEQENATLHEQVAQLTRRLTAQRSRPASPRLASPEQPPAAVMVPQYLTTEAIGLKVDFLKALDAEIARINKAKYGADTRVEKVGRITELRNAVLATLQTKPLDQVIAAFNQANGAFMSQQRRDGFFARFNPGKPHTQQVIDKYAGLSVKP